MRKRWIKAIGTGMLAAVLAIGPVQSNVKAESVSNITVLESTNKLVNGKMKVSFDVQNGGSGTEAGFYVLGYSENGKVIEAVGDSSFMTSNEIGTFEVDLDSGSKIKKVEVKPAGEAGSKAVLLASGTRTEKSGIEVSAVVQNSTQGRKVGVMAVGYDASGKAVEVGSAQSYLGGGEVATYNLRLKAANLVKNVELTTFDSEVDGVKLLQTGSRLENGKFVVTGSVQNGNEGGQVGVVVVGKNAKGKVLEVNTTSGYLGSVEINDFVAEFDAGKAVASYKVIITGNSRAPKIIAEGFTRINNKLSVTIGIKNGEKGQRITVKSTAYNSKGRRVGADTDFIYMVANETTTLQLTYRNKNVASVKLKYYDEAGREIRR
ncbi:hypothetical protein [Paenibacillus sp. DMB20]|uniref:hypothetical protein n=1 Tax=Paenibacillus sp. DMB20 TaxID=1642570 RepID=UPI00069ADADB|nr:hypothetical protein [Paenibacillus sp. DMB20]